MGYKPLTNELCKCSCRGYAVSHDVLSALGGLKEFHAELVEIIRRHLCNYRASGDTTELVGIELLLGCFIASDDVWFPLGDESGVED